MERSTDSGTGVALVVAGAALFGTLGVFGEAARLAGLSTATLLGVRFLAATVVLWGYLALRGGRSRLDGSTLAVELGLGLVYGLMSVAYFESLAWLSAGVAALVLFTYPVQVTLVSAVTLGEPVSVPKAAALLTALDAGYFEEPREVTLREVAAELDISQPAAGGLAGGSNGSCWRRSLGRTKRPTRRSAPTVRVWRRG